MKSLAVIGPGRLGSALGRRLVDAGVELTGFVGRSEGSAERAVAFCGAGRVLGADELGGAAAVLVGVGDDDLEPTVAALVAAGIRAATGALWLHASGYHDRAVLAPIADRTAILHPLCPIPDPATGYAALDGALISVDADPADAPGLHDLARRARLQPLALAAGADRTTYHAACALAANGATALHDLAAGLFAAVFESADANRATSALMRQAVELSAQHGSRAALSGPVARGDRDVVAGHLDSLRDPDARSVYAGLMRRAVDMAVNHGSLDPERAAELRALLERDG